VSAGIARKQSQYKDKFDSAVVYDKFHSWLTRAAKYPFPQTASTVQDAMLEYLTAHKETRASQWFRDYMTGDEEGMWMLAHSNIGSSANNMGNESHFKWVKAACNSKRHVSLNHFLGSFLAYVEDCCTVEYTKIVSMLSLEEEELSKLTSESRPFAYASTPKIPVKTWERVQRLDWACLSEASIEAPQDDVKRFYDAIDAAAAAFTASKPSAPGIFTISDAWPFYDTSQVFRTHAHLRRVVFPTQQYVEHMRDKFFDWTEKVLSGAVRFLNVCIKKTATGSMKEYIRLAEDFILCEALETKWSVEVRHKCSCPMFFRKGQCEHVVLLAMLAAPTEVLLPNRSDLRQIRSRAGKKRGRPAGDGDSDSLEEPRKKPKEQRTEKEPALQSALLSDSESEVLH